MRRRSGGPKRERYEVGSSSLPDGYLLAPEHPEGRHKARFFAALGYTRSEADQLAAELLRIARQFEVVETTAGDHGIRYVVDGTIRAPRGVPATIRTVWIIDPEHDDPRLVTAYPLRTGTDP